MGETSNAVFVSYRRDVSQFLAQALWQNLTERGIDVFYDLETIHAGQFESIILAQIAARPYMVPVLQRGALNRCVNQGDWLRREIEAAIARDRMLVPVFTPEFDFGDIERFLPADTAAALRGFNMLEIPPKYFKYAIQELAENFLAPIQRELTEPTAVARVAAVSQAARSRQRPSVTAETLTAEEYFARAYQADEEGNYEGAIADYGEAIRLKPDYADAFNNRGAARNWLGDYEGAIADYDEAIRLNPDDAVVFYNRGYTRGNLGDYERAIADCDEAIHLKPDYADAFNNRGVARGNLGDYEGAIADYDEAICLNPGDAAAFYNRGVARGNLGDYEGAIADYDEAIRLKPDYAAAFYNRGYARDSLGDYEEAIADYDEAIRLNPDDAAAFNNRGEALLLAGELDKALTALDEAIRLDSEDALEALVLSGAILWHLGHADEAKTRWTSALTSGTASLTRFRAAELKAIAHAGLGNPGLALTVLRGALPHRTAGDQYKLELYELLSNPPIPDIDDVRQLVAGS